MSKKNLNVPDFLQIKGYKYRAKIIICVAVILIVFLTIIISIIRGISGHTSKHDIPTATDTDSSVSESNLNISDNDTISSITSDNISSSKNESSKPENTSKMQLDADGKVIIDTDTLDGKKAIALTFDDGPGEYTDILLDGLAERDVKATFFMLGICVEKYPDTVKRIFNEGHQLGNHTYNHVDITTLSEKEINDQITKTDNAMFNACGQFSTAFRPPYGTRNEKTDLIINDKIITLWSIDTIDWKTKNSNEIKNSIVANCHDGDVILMHDIYKSTVDGALAAIDELKKQDFVFVTVEELFERYGYEATRNEPHYSQYAVYETNSPYAKKYQEQIDSEISQSISDEAANAFYDEPSQKPINSDSNKSSSDVVSKSTVSKPIV